MLFAVWFQTWGLIAARSDNGSTSFDKMPGRLLNRYFPSWFGNILCLCIPMVSSMAGVLPGVIGNKLCERARHGWYDWHDKYDGMSQLTRDMVVDAQNIFHSSIHSAYYICICLTIWGIWCFVFGAAYTYASCSLISDLADHLETKAFDPPPRRPETAVHMFSAHYSKADRNERQPSQRGAVSEWLTASPAASESVFNGTSSGRRNEQHRGLIQGRMFTDQERVQDLSFSFFPPIAPSRTIVRLPTSHARRALFFFTIQSASVILACVAFLGDALFMLLQSYAAAEANRYESAVISGYTATSIITLLAGTGSFVSVTHTTFEASFSVLIFARRGYQGNSDEEQAADDFLDMA
ncbi:unnamed protein product [Tilletia caries]|nr:unnamed protein product [Tilletia caries]